MSLQSTEMPTTYMRSNKLNILRWGVGPGKVDDFTYFIYLAVTMGPSPKELSVTPAKGPDREQAAASSGEQGSVCLKEGPPAPALGRV